jgi:hypothetical protein
MSAFHSNSSRASAALTRQGGSVLAASLAVVEAPRGRRSRSAPRCSASCCAYPRRLLARIEVARKAIEARLHLLPRFRLIRRSSGLTSPSLARARSGWSSVAALDLKRRLSGCSST